MLSSSLRFACRFLPFLFIIFQLNFNCGDHKRLLLLLHLKKCRRPDVEFMEGIVSKVSLTIPSLDQFFASSTFSSSPFAKPWNFCIQAANS